jgi:hypothetical protein
VSWQRFNRGASQDITIWKSADVVDNRGHTVRVADSDGPYEVKAMVYPQRSSRAEMPGQQSIEVYRILIPPDYADVDLWSKVIYQGKDYDLVSPPVYHHGATRHNRHWTIDIRLRPHSG